MREFQQRRQRRIGTRGESAVLFAVHHARERVRERFDALKWVIEMRAPMKEARFSERERERRGR